MQKQNLSFHSNDQIRKNLKEEEEEKERKEGRKKKRNMRGREGN